MKSSMKIVAGGIYGTAPVEVEGESVRFVAEDGREMFEILLGKDGHSIEVRGVTSCKVDGVLYHEHLAIHPRAANNVIISATPLE